MLKRIRRGRRYILVDSEKTAKNIERYCLDNSLVEGLFGEAYTTCYATNIENEINPKWAVIFYCTLDQWKQIEKHYNLIRLNTKYIYEYKLKNEIKRL